MISGCCCFGTLCLLIKAHMGLRKEAAAGASPHVALADGDDIMSAQSVPYCRWVGCKINEKLKNTPPESASENVNFYPPFRETHSRAFSRPLALVSPA